MAGFSSVYGFSSLGLDEAKELIERALKIELSPHDSLYRGGDYYRSQQADAELILQQNYDCLDEDLAETDFPDSKTLLYLDGKEQAEEIASRLAEIAPEAALLRHVRY